VIEYITEGKNVEEAFLKMKSKKNKKETNKEIEEKKALFENLNEILNKLMKEDTKKIFHIPVNIEENPNYYGIFIL
jgi:hypothetical protein